MSSVTGMKQPRPVHGHRRHVWTGLDVHQNFWTLLLLEGHIEHQSLTDWCHESPAVSSGPFRFKPVGIFHIWVRRIVDLEQAPGNAIKLYSHCN